MLLFVPMSAVFVALGTALVVGAYTVCVVASSAITDWAIDRKARHD